jgi:formylglycine-generating enzyme required for sulfatase activity
MAESSRAGAFDVRPHVIVGLVVWSGCSPPSFENAPPCTSDVDCAFGQYCDLEYDRCRVSEDEMHEVAGGTFMMGCAGEGTVEPDCDSDETAHLVTLSTYWIDTYEVTQSAYAQCMEAGACTVPSSEFAPTAHRDRPVRSVTHDQAIAFCTWRGKRLPSEAEWEYACRGKDRRVWPWGNDAPSCSLANMSTCLGTVMPVGSLPAGASPALALDLAGNVSEWVGDWYSSTYYAATDGATDPAGPDPDAASCVSGTGACRVTRGGHYARGAIELRCADREPELPSASFIDIGFRCATSQR